MNCYIREIKMSFWARIINKINIKQIGEDIEIIIPRKSKIEEKCTKISNWLENRLIKKIFIIKEKYKTRNFIISCDERIKLKQITGKIFYKYMLKKTIEYIVKQKEQTLERQSIYICANNIDEVLLYMLVEIGKNVKSIHIVTKSLKNMHNVEEYLEENNIIVTVTNNKHKALKRAKIIINIDFNEKELQEYIIQRNAIIINVNNTKIQQKSFEGVNIRSIMLKAKQENNDIVYLKKYYDSIKIYESEFIKKKQTLDLKQENELQNNIEILYLIGNKGKISDTELCIE